MKITLQRHRRPKQLKCSVESFPSNSCSPGVSSPSAPLMDLKPLLILLLLLMLPFYPLHMGWGDEVVFTVPHCPHYKYPVPLSTKDNNILDAPTGALYCEASRVPITNGYALTEILDENLGGSTIRRVDLAAYYFRDSRFADWLCSRRWTNDAQIYIHHQQWKSGVPHVSTEFRDQLNRCPIPVHFIPIGCDIFDDTLDSTPDPSEPSSTCQRGFVSILHAKIGRFVTTDGTTITYLGSGNINKSLYANIDDWVVLHRRHSDPFNEHINCIFSTLQTFAYRTDVKVKHFRSAHESCLEGQSLTNHTSVPAIILTPYRGTQYFSRVIADIQEADSVWVMSQFLGDTRVINALSKRTKGGLKILLDDDNYWSLEKERDEGYAQWKRVQRLRSLQTKEGTQIRYLQTNHHSSGKDNNMLHTRIIRAYPVNADTHYM